MTALNADSNELFSDVLDRLWYKSRAKANIVSVLTVLEQHDRQCVVCVALRCISAMSGAAVPAASSRTYLFCHAPFQARFHPRRNRGAESSRVNG
jgi:hypothetical protein